MDGSDLLLLLFWGLCLAVSLAIGALTSSGPLRRPRLRRKPRPGAGERPPDG